MHVLNLTNSRMHTHTHTHKQYFLKKFKLTYTGISKPLTGELQCGEKQREKKKRLEISCQ